MSLNSELHVSLAGRDDEGEATVVAAEVIGPVASETRTMPMETGQTQVLEVPPGVYLVRLTTPAGDLVAATTELHANETRQVTLRLPGSGLAGRASVFEVGDDTGMIGAVRPNIWARLWQDGIPRSWPNQPAPLLRLPAHWTINLPSHAYASAVQIGANGSAWRAVALPPAFDAVLSFRAVPPADDFDDGLHVEVRSSNPRVAAMLEYLTVGQANQAKVVAGGVVELATELFRDKIASPEGAAAAGYVLLRVHESKKLRNWGNNFANWFEWLPDAQIIHAWQLLSGPDAPDLGLVRERLLHAAKAGIPRYTEGLRLLFEGLRSLMTTSPDNTIREALDRVQRYADACDWSATMTTYWCRNPIEPSLERHIGPPETDRDVLRL